jgi:cbb3-type cytochrome oxidase subunit 3
MGFGAIQAAAGGFLVLLALAVVWLAYRLKNKNKQLRNAMLELERRPQEPNPPVVPKTRAMARIPERAATVDAFLWQHLGDAFLWKHLSDDKVAPPATTQSESGIFPIGMCNRAALQPFLEVPYPFTGLVVLVGITHSRTPRLEHPAKPFIEELLRPLDFACREGEDEFLIVCPGLHGSEAQRRLNEISERLWNFQLRGQGSFSVLFSWGGIGIENEPLSEAIASATGRMQQTKRSRVVLFRRKAG